MNDILAGIRTLTAASGVEQDVTGAEPYDWRPGTQYVYMADPVREVAIETGPTSRQDFAARLVEVFDAAVAGESAHEEAARTRYAAITDAIDARLEALLAIFRANRRTATWGQVQVEVDPRPPATLTGRALALRITGYRIV